MSQKCVSLPGTARQWSGVWRFGWIIILLIPVLLTAGCATTMTMGEHPRTDRIDELITNESGKQDILRVLGQPQGRGAVRSQSFGLKEAWLYESTELSGKTAKMRMLMVFLDKQRGLYQGHLWFASGLLFGQTK